MARFFLAILTTNYLQEKPVSSLIRNKVLS
jgi:hypothetical protein